MNRNRVLSALLIFFTMGFSSCGKEDSISKTQAEQLNKKLDALNAKMDSIEGIPNLEKLPEVVKLYKQEATRALCILNIRNIHQAVRANHGVKGKNFGEPLLAGDIIGKDKYIETMPLCPNGGIYAWAKTYPKIGVTAVTCSHGESLHHHPTDTSGW